MLGVSLVAIKAYHLGVPPRDGLSDYLRSLSAISYVDALFAAVCWAAARLVLLIVWRRPFAGRAVSVAFVVFAAFCCLYAVVNIILFGIVGGFLTYPLLAHHRRRADGAFLGRRSRDAADDRRPDRDSMCVSRLGGRPDSPHASGIVDEMGEVRVRRSSQQPGLRRAITRM